MHSGSYLLMRWTKNPFDPWPKSQYALGPNTSPRFPMLHTLRPAPGATHRRRRVGRGNASGTGTTAGRGTKGQHARTGKGQKFGFEGGQVPLLMRQPKLGGFKRPRRVDYAVVNLADLEQLEAGSYDVAALRARKLVRRTSPVKVLGDGTLSKKLALSVHAVSKTAKAAIEKAGGSITILRD